MQLMKKMMLMALLMVVQAVQAQESERDVVLRAMEDEMKRSMTELSLKDHDRPFFISYKVSDQTSMVVSASFGAITSSTAGPGRTSSVRVIVGDYEFNDESFSDSQYELGPMSFQDDMGIGSMGAPLGADYYGIRRDLWASTESVYRSAAKKFKKFNEILKKDGKDLDSIPHFRFARVPVVQHEDEPKPHNWDKALLEERARKLSATFIDYPDLTSGRVIIRYNHETSYFMTTEGSRIIEEFTSATIMLNIGVSSEKNGENTLYISYNGETPEELPTDEQLKADIAKVIADERNKASLPKFDDSYEGPILFYDEAVASAVQGNLANSFYASTMARLVPSEWGEAPNRGMERKMGKRVTSRNLSLAFLPGTQTYKGKKTRGTYRYDSEGVKAIDSLLIVDKGYLKNLIYNRNVLNDTLKPRGTASGPGMISLVSHKTATEAELKQQLIELAEDEGLEYAFIIRPGKVNKYDLRYFKVDLEDGSETEVRSASMSDLDFNSFRKVEATSADRVVTGGSNFGYMGITTVVAPRVMLIEDISVEYASDYNYRPNNNKKKVPSPLTGKE